MPRVTFQCNQSFELHVSELFFYKSKILALLQTLINASQLHQNVLFATTKNFSLRVTIRPKHGETQALLPVDVPTNFYVDLFGLCQEIRIFVDLRP